MRPAYLIALAAVLLVGFWMTGRADPALASMGLNKTDCYQSYGYFVCGDDLDPDDLYLTGPLDRQYRPGRLSGH